MCKFVKKYYSTLDDMFHIETYRNTNYGKEIISDVKYKTLKSFAEAIKHNFNGVDLYYYKFKRNETHKYDISRAILNADYQIEIGVFNDKLYNKFKKQFRINVLDEKNYELCIRKPQFDDFDYHDNNIIYISDIHLNCKKVFNETFIKPFNEFDLIYYIKEYADKFIEAYKEFKRPLCDNDFCFILGDLSYNISINYYFFKEIKDKIKNLYFVLGNHELWNYDNICDSANDKLSQIRNKYTNMLNELNVNFLNNTLVVSDGYNNIRKIEERELEELDIQDIRNLCIKSSFILFGGTGFSGYNNEYNAKKGIYRETLSRKDEISETEKFEGLYNKLVEACSDLTVTIATHMPFGDWCKGSRVSGWTYINGHTHRNGFVYDLENNIKDFHDNQVGYYSQNISFRNIPVKNTFDIFKDYEDGIYDNISRKDYIDFYRGHNIYINFNSSYKKIYLLKNSGFYFFMMLDDKDNLYYLDGGNKRKTVNKDINYYYNNMVFISMLINAKITPIQNLLNKISLFVKGFKGSGRIHGTIIDIDRDNHLYFNVKDKENDKRIYCYYAPNTVQHFVYDNLISLLSDKRKDLLDTYVKLINSKKNNELMPVNAVNNLTINKNTQVYDGTQMYNISKQLIKLQYTFNQKVLRIWSDEIILKNSKELPVFIDDLLND